MRFWQAILCYTTRTPIQRRSDLRTMIDRTITRATARRVYNRLGAGLDRAARYESQAKARALALLDLQPGMRVLHVGVGTGAEHAALLRAVGPAGLVVGLDLSRTMLNLTRRRAPGPLAEADALRLPVAAAAFDRLFSAYLLDLLPAAELPLAIAELLRALRPGGRLGLVSLTEGVDRPSRRFVARWTLGFRLSPARFGGCRPLQLAPLLAAQGLAPQREVVVQRGMPSEVLVATIADL